MSIDQEDIATVHDQAEQGVHRLQSTIDQLFTLARVEGAAEFADDEKLDACSIVEHAIALLPPGAGTAGAPAQQCSGRGITRALRIGDYRAASILDNALRKGANVDDVLLDVVAADDRVLFVVTDNGPGISVEKLGKARSASGASVPAMAAVLACLASRRLPRATTAR